MVGGYYYEANELSLRKLPLVALLILIATPAVQVAAIPTFYGGYVNTEGVWMRLLNIVLQC